MPSYLTETAYRFCTRGGEYYSLFQQNRAAYEWIGISWPEFDKDGESISKGSFRAILRYMSDLKKAPTSIDALLQFIVTTAFFTQLVHSYLWLFRVVPAR